MHFIVFLINILEPKKSKIKAYKSPPASQILWAALISSFSVCATVRENDSLWGSFFHRCVTRGQDDVTAFEAQRVQSRGIPTAGLRKASPWVPFVFRRGEWLRFGKKKKRRAKCPQHSATCGHQPVIPGAQKQQWEVEGCWWVVVRRGRTRWPEVSRFQGNVTLDKQTQCSPNPFGASAILLSQRQLPHPLSTEKILREQPEPECHEGTRQTQSLTWPWMHWSEWGPGRGSSSGFNGHPMGTATVTAIPGFARLVSCVHTRQQNQ